MMNETITRAAGATHGEGKTPQELEALILKAGRQPRQRSTDYGDVSSERQQAGRHAAPLAAVINNMDSGKASGKPRRLLVRFAVETENKEIGGCAR